MSERQYFLLKRSPNRQQQNVWHVGCRVCWSLVTRRRASACTCSTGAPTSPTCRLLQLVKLRLHAGYYGYSNFAYMQVTIVTQTSLTCRLLQLLSFLSTSALNLRRHYLKIFFARQKVKIYTGWPEKRFCCCAIHFAFGQP